jgi:hypothetical protein
VVSGVLLSADCVSTAQQKSIPFYENLGMTLCREVHMSDFSLYFLSCLPEGVTVTHSPLSHTLISVWQ